MSNLQGMDIVMVGRKVGIVLQYGDAKFIVTTNLFGKFVIRDEEEIKPSFAFRIPGYGSNTSMYAGQGAVMRGIRSKHINEILKGIGMKGDKSIVFALTMTHAMAEYEIEDKVTVKTFESGAQKVMVNYE